MASILYALKCPCCNRSAYEDYYYKTEEQYTICNRCGYSYSKSIQSYTKTNGFEYREEKSGGHGIFVLVSKEGSRKNIFLNERMSDEEFEEFTSLFLAADIDQEKSYLVSYRDGVFSIILGNPPETFHLPFEEYREKVFAKYGVPEYDFMVPIEE